MKKKIFTIKDNGVYIVYKDGKYEKFNNKNRKDDIAMIGIAHDGHTFGIPLDWNYGTQKLLTQFVERDSHCMNESDALLNWDFVGETEYFKTIGLLVPLKEGHYLYTAPVFLAMYKNKIQLNKALLYAGTEEIDFNANIWFAQRYNVFRAWFFDGYGGSLSSYYVYNAFQVGAVTLWEP